MSPTAEEAAPPRSIRIDVGDVLVQDSPILGQEDPASTLLVSLDEIWGPGERTASAALEDGAPPASSDNPKLATASDSIAQAGSGSVQATRQGTFLSPDSSFQRTTESAVGVKPGTDADQMPEEAPASATTSSTVLPGGALSVEAVDPTGGKGPDESSGAMDFGSPLAWLVSLFVSAVLLTIIMVALMRAKRTKGSEVSLPPPTVGPERRITQLPHLPSQQNEGRGTAVGNN